LIRWRGCDRVDNSYLFDKCIDAQTFCGTRFFQMIHKVVVLIDERAITTQIKGEKSLKILYPHCHLRELILKSCSGESLYAIGD
jgi:hypothetical protein